MRSYLVLGGIVLALGVDQISKYVAQQQVKIILNQGVSFGLFPGPLLPLATSLVLIVLGIYSWKVWRGAAALPTGLLLGGAFSNLIDRLVYGGVRDFLPVPFLGINNNLADWCIVLSLLWILGQEIWIQKR